MTRRAISPRLAIRTASNTVGRSRPEAPRDDHLLDLVGALADGEDLRVAVEAADRVLLDVPVAAVDLDRLLGRADGEPAGLQLRLGGGQPEWPALVLQPGGAVREQPRGLDLGRDVRELRLDRLEGGDRPAERAALL